MSPFFLVIYGGLPLGLYLGLALLPRGRWAAGGLALGAGLAGWVWARSDPWGQVLGMFLGYGVGLAAVAQGLRLWQGRFYVLIVPGLMVLTMALALYLMGI